MALPRLEKDIAYISKLDDMPNDKSGMALSADDLKARYDQAGQDIQEFINNELIPRVESDIEAAALGVGSGGAINGDTIANGSIGTEKLADGSITAEKLAAGSVGTEKIADKSVTTEKLADSGISGAKIADKAVTREKLADEAVSADKIFPGAVGNTKLAANSVSADKILNGAVSQSFTAAVPADGWTGDAAPYTNTVTAAGITADDTPIWDILCSEDMETVEKELEAYALVYRMTTANNSVTFYAIEKPEVPLNIQIKAVRK